MLNVVALVFWLGVPLLALYGRWRRALGWLGAGLVSVLVLTQTVLVVPLSLLLPLGAGIDAIRIMRRGRPARWALDGLGLALAAQLAVGAVAELAVHAYQIPSSGMCPTLRIGDHLFGEKLSLRWRAPARGEVVVLVAPDGRDFIKRVIGVGGDVVAVRGGKLFLDDKPVETTAIGATTYQNLDEPSGVWSVEPVTEFEESLGGHRYRILHGQPADMPDDPSAHDLPHPDPSFPVTCEDATPARMQAMQGQALPSDWPHLTTVAGGCKVPDGAIFVMGDNRDNSSDSRVWGPVPVDRVTARIVGVWMPADHPSRAWGRLGAID